PSPNAYQAAYNGGRTGGRHGPAGSWNSATGESIMMRPAILLTALMSACLAVSGPAAAQKLGKPLVLDLWPGKAPGEVGNVGAETATGSKPGEKPVLRISNVSHPTLTV